MLVQLLDLLGSTKRVGQVKLYIHIKTNLFYLVQYLATNPSKINVPAIS